MESCSGKKRITIIGSGFSGTLTATRLLEFADTPVEICLLEREEGYRYGGIAYGTAATTWEHMLNIQAGRITLYRDRAEDFIEWANNEADRSTWPSRWKYHVFGISCVVPRRIYGQYLKERLWRARADAHRDVSLVELTGEAIDVRPEGDGYTVKYVSVDDQGTPHTLRSDFVVLATGHLDPVRKPFYHRIAGSDRFIADPYAPQARAIFESIDPGETVLVVGTALSAFDAVVSLVSAGHEGRIVICSREGNLHATYPSDHQHDIWRVRRPPFLDAEELTAESVIKGVREEYEYLCGKLTAEEHVAPSVLPERVMKAWEPYVIELVERLAPEDVRRLLDTYKSLIVTRRTSTVPQIGDVVRNRMRGFNGAPKTVSVMAARIDDMRLIDGGRKVRVLFADGSDLVVDRVVNCLGNETHYERAGHPLWHSLLGRSVTRPHVKTHRGIEVSARGQLVAADGRLVDRLFCVGPMRQGDETARRGRLGAFVFSIGTVRNQSFDTAMEVLRQLRYGTGRGYLDLPDEAHPSLADMCERLVGHLGFDLAEPETCRLQDRLLTCVQQAVYPRCRSHLMASERLERMSHRHALEDALDHLRMELVQETGLDTEQVGRLVSALAVLTEKYAVDHICDITRLSEWRSEKYIGLVKTAGSRTPGGTAPQSRPPAETMMAPGPRATGPMTTARGPYGRAESARTAERAGTTESSMTDSAMTTESAPAGEPAGAAMATTGVGR